MKLQILMIIISLLFLAAFGLAVYGLITLIRRIRARKSVASGRDMTADTMNDAPPSLAGDEKATGPQHVPLPDEEPVPAAVQPLPEAVPLPEQLPPEAMPAAAPDPALKPAILKPAAQGASSDAAPGKSAMLRNRLPLSGKGEIMDKLFYRCLLIAGITLALLIPLGFVLEIVNERSSLHREAVDDIAGLWGHAQTINGPALVIPYLWEYTYKENVENADGKTVTETRKGRRWEQRLFLPADLLFEASLAPQVRHRGIYEYVVYTSSVKVSGIFRLPRTVDFGENVIRIAWESAWLALGVTDLRAITGVNVLQWNGADCPPYNPGTGLNDLLGPGFQGPVILKAEDAGAERDFSLDLTLNGSGGIYFTPVGETTRIKVTGDWPHPKFGGNLLPVTRNISDRDFSAEWLIPHLSRTYPQSGVVSEETYNSRTIPGFTAGVDLFEVVSLYSQTRRAVKYGLLFIGLTFTALLAFELVRRKRLHLMQYALVGLAMTLFYLTLLSLAEHTRFITAFAAASVVSIVMNSSYVAAALRSGRQGLTVAGLLAALYLLLYALLQMEEYALLIGTGLVLVVLGILMWLTRNLPVDKNGESPPDDDQKSRAAS